jgi:hypothetical protein
MHNKLLQAPKFISVTLIMEAVCSYVTQTAPYQTTWPQVAEGHHPRSDHYDNFQSIRISTCKID